MHLQANTLQLFTALRLLRADWAGALVLGVGLQHEGQALALASLGAGAAGLFLEPDSSTLREAQRNGACTFAVTTLDEALRALKNEIRQRRAITVGLSGNWLGEIMERGVLPSIVASETPQNVDQLIAWGAEPVHGRGLAQLADTSTDLAALLHKATDGRWSVIEDEAASLKERRIRDEELAHACREGEGISNPMRHWLRVAPSLFPRDRARSHWVPIESGD